MFIDLFQAGFKGGKRFIIQVDLVEYYAGRDVITCRCDQEPVDEAGRCPGRARVTTRKA